MAVEGCGSGERTGCLNLGGDDGIGDAKPDLRRVSVLGLTAIDGHQNGLAGGKDQTIQWVLGVWLGYSIWENEL